MSKEISVEIKSEAFLTHDLTVIFDTSQVETLPDYFLVTLNLFVPEIMNITFQMNLYKTFNTKISAGL